jgi:tryptophanyl-tRNA synthetase
MTEQAPVAYAGPQRVLSGVQPSGALHLGNYLGALVKFTRLQREMETFIFIADMHAITVWQEPAQLAAQVREIAAAYLAAGLDPKIATIFPQSAVGAHAELAWVFNCVARLGWLDRMTQFKDKAGKHKERESVGLYTYPVLQAADILLYKATHVPVGEDQKQHVELTRDIAGKFNHDFDAPGFFPLPEPMIEGPGARIMSLRDGSAKMSKSDPSDNSRINLMDDADTIAQKVRKARTDPEPLPETLDELKGRPEAQNLIGIYAALDGRTQAQVLSEFAGQGFGAFKPRLADLAVAKLGPVGDAMRGYMSDPGEIDSILAAGAVKARSVAAPTLAQVKKLVGFWGA